MHVVIKKIVCFFLLTYLFFCFALQAEGADVKQKIMMQKPSYEDLLQWHSLLTSFSSLQQPKSGTSLKINSTKKVGLSDKDLDRLLAAIARGKKKPFLKKRYYILIFLTCYLSYKIVKATKWYMEYWDTFFKDLFSFFEIPLLDSLFGWFKELFSYNPFAFLFDWLSSKEVLDEVGEVKKMYREYDADLKYNAELQKEFFLSAEKTKEAIRENNLQQAKKQEEHNSLLKDLYKKQDLASEKLDERLSTQETLINSIKKETQEACISLNDLLENSVDHATECKERLDEDFVACKETIDSLKKVVEEQIENVKKGNQADLLKEILEVKKVISSMIAPQSEPAKKIIEPVKKPEVVRAPVLAPPKIIESVKKVEIKPVAAQTVKEVPQENTVEVAQGTAEMVIDGLKEYAMASVNPDNFTNAVESQILIYFLPETMKKRKEERDALRR